MTPQEAKKILHPETTLEAYAETDYYGGFNGAKKWKEAVDEACLVACEALEKQIPKKVDMQTEDDREFIDYVCPCCETTLQQKIKVPQRYLKSTIYKYRFCLHCGQALDWSDKE